MGKCLLSVVTCHKRPEFSNAVRSTWYQLRDHQADVKFFIGREGEGPYREDEVVLDCDDSYLGLPNKVQEIIRWAYDHGYDFVAKIDDDVVVNPQAYMASDFQEHDFVGPQNPWVKAGEIRTPWGFFYTLSRRAMKLVIDAPLPGRQGSTHTYSHGNDEAWISTVLHINGVFLHEDPRYFLHRGVPLTPRPRGLRPLNRPRPAVPVPVPGTFAWCVYIDSGLHNVPSEDMLKEYFKIWKETQNVLSR
jgi:hypothetical protein